MTGLYCRYEITGDKTEYLLDWLHEKTVKIYDFVYIENGIILTIEYKDSEKLFAISSNMCYNIKKIGYKGKFAPVKILAEKLGLAIGGIAFFALAVLSDAVITGVDYKGDASRFKKEIESALNSSGIAEWSAVGEKDLEKASKNILLSSDEISFASLKKSGRRLVIEVRGIKREPVRLNLKKSVILSTANGVVGKITLLGGTALVNTGDEVKAGDALIDGSYSHGEKSGETYALGEVEIISEKIYEYEGVGDEDRIKSRAVLLASYDIPGEILSTECAVKEDGGKMTCVVKIRYSVWVS